MSQCQCLPDANQLLTQNHEWAIRNSDLHDKIKDRQCPRVLWLGCSDSRVPESVITAALPGHIFVHRNIGNVYSQIDDSFRSVLEFSLFDPTAPEIGIAVCDIVIVGHTDCGAIKASRDIASGNGGNIPEAAPYLRRWLEPIVQLAHSLPGATVEELTIANIRRQVELIADSPVLARDRLARSTKPPVTIHGWLHDLSTGMLSEVSAVKHSDIQLTRYKNETAAEDD
ncbi:hypothetical protein QCA50_008092 [Cerrena zonata]|uniref:Carbonic anhydrase n=1 Tax=Cerrena zonata TaxID=2478898 RepID=A0AAW0GEZ2_9APHY